MTGKEFIGRAQALVPRLAFGLENEDPFL